MNMKLAALFVVAIAGGAFAGDPLQDLANITAINALNNQRSIEAVNGGTQIFVPSVSVEQYNALVRQYNDLLSLAKSLEAENAYLRYRQGWLNNVEPD